MNNLDELPRRILESLGDNYLPATRQDFESELDMAREKGYCVPDNINYEDGIYTQEQASLCLSKMGIAHNSLFYEIMSRYRDFPVGSGEELNPLEQIASNADDQYWDDDYPGFSEKYLELSSIEGEGSYFYDKATDSVYDVDWCEMDDFVSGDMEPTWETFKDFIEWYYA